MNPLRPIKAVIWLYFWLLTLEGVLRKWVLPEWSDEIFVIRDPVVVLLYLLAWRAGVFPRRPAMVVLWILMVASLAFSFANEAPPMVTLFGLRTNYLHVPMVFVMAAVLDRNDILAFGRWSMILALPIAALMVVQFNSDPTAWVNVGAGGKESGQLLGSMGHVRAPGPFSFISGIVSYFGVVIAFLLYGWIQGGVFGRLLLGAVTLAVAVAVPVSVSRSLLFALVIVTTFGLVAAMRDLRRLPAFVGPIALALALVSFASDTTYVEAFQSRWGEGLRAGGGDFSSNIVGRLSDDLQRPVELLTEAPLFGHGIGMGTVAGARLSTGRYSFLFSESEPARVIDELGPVLGVAFMGWRIWLVGALAVGSWHRLRKERDGLPWLLTGAMILLVVYGQWGQATQLGFAVFSAGLVLAALNPPAAEERAEVGDETGDTAMGTEAAHAVGSPP